jgi:threonine dehydratase
MTLTTLISLMAKKTTASRTTFTSVPVKPETLRRLRSYKVGGKTYDDVLNDFMDETPTAEFWKEMDRRMKEEPRLVWDSKKRKFA